MLILSRKKGQSIVINNNIVVNIVELADGRVKLGIDAPKDVSIYRSELIDTVREENLKSKLSKEKMDELVNLLKK